ncbi:ABC transporter substrate-binding protein [Actinocrispum sp. NPDC049592]|uniref:ABC transporter substrate-binding protein n=1 Tax=Actinocrispum sp. NPDC049592 TaxID=3154835 RepID=UPI003445BC08
MGAWFTRLRDAADAELPPSGMDRRRRAELILEVVEAMRRPDPAVAPALAKETPVPGRVRGKHRAETVRGPARHRAGGRSPAVARFLHASRRTQSFIIAAVVVAVFAAVTAALVRLPEDPSPGAGAFSDSVIGRPKLRVGVLPVVDVAPFFRALDAGYFAQEGVDIETVTVQSGPDAVSALGRRLDVAFSSYPAILQAQSDGKADLKIISPAYTALPGHLELVVPPEGSIQKAEDVPGKRIAVTGTGSISDLGVLSQLRNRNLDGSSIRWVPMAMPDMPAAMQRGEIDGAVLAEPYLTITNSDFHARPIVDVALGQPGGLPISGWAVRAQDYQRDRDALDAFVRALRRGIADMGTAAILQPLLVKYLRLDPATAQKVRIAEYTADIAAGDIQRVADLMREFGAISRPLPVQPMLLPR